MYLLTASSAYFCTQALVANVWHDYTPPRQLIHARKRSVHVLLCPRTLALNQDPLKIDALIPGSAAEHAGLKRGDKLEAINGTAYNTCVHRIPLFLWSRFEHGGRSDCAAEESNCVVYESKCMAYKLCVRLV